MVARAWQRSGVDRSRLQILTRSPHFRERDVQVFHRDVESSLRTLKTDYVDIFQGHGVDSPDIIRGGWLKESFAELKRKGRIRFSGVSTHDFLAIAPAILADPYLDVVQIPFNFLMPDDYLDLVKRVRKAGVGVVAMKTRAGIPWRKRKWEGPAVRYAVGSSSVDTVALRVETVGDLDMYREMLQSPYTAEDESVLHAIGPGRCPGLLSLLPRLRGVVP